MNEVKSLDVLKVMIEKELGVLLYLSAPTCNVCHALKPKITHLFENAFPKIKRLSVDTSVSPEIAAHFGIFSIPAVLVFLDGKEFVKEGRNISIAQFEAKISRIYQLLTGE